MENTDNTKAYLAEIMVRVAHKLAAVSQKTEKPMTEEELTDVMDRCLQVLKPEEAKSLAVIADATMKLAGQNVRPEVTEVRPRE